MGEARRRGTYEERRREVQQRMRPGTEIDLDRCKLELPAFELIFNLTQHLAAQALARGHAPSLKLSAHRQDDGSLFVRAKDGAVPIDRLIPADQWRLLTQEEVDADRNHRFSQRPDPSLFEDLADSINKQADAMRAWQKRVAAKASEATCSALIIDKSARGISIADDFRRRDLVVSILDEWEKTDAEFVVIVVPAEGSPGGSCFAKDIDSLLGEVVPGLLSNDLFGEIVHFTVATDAELFERIHTACEMLQRRSLGLSS